MVKNWLILTNFIGCIFNGHICMFKHHYCISFIRGLQSVFTDIVLEYR